MSLPLPTPPIRARLNQILYRHYMMHHGNDQEWSVTPKRDQQMREALLDDLCKLWPEPSRKSASDLVLRTIGERETSFRDDWIEKVIDLWMAWATAPREEKWCAHIKWDSEMCPKSPSWFLRDGNGEVGTPVMDDWTICPVCAAPRPTNVPA